MDKSYTTYLDMDNFSRLYPLDSGWIALSKLRTTEMTQSDKCYPPDSDLSADKSYPLFEQPGPGG